MILSKQHITSIQSTAVTVPAKNIFELPEKVLQFGTGVLLRGLPDYFIDKANRLNIFNGRVVVVKSTNGGGADTFDKQDNLYTHCIRGVDGNIKVDEAIINSSVSRVLTSAEQWEDILQCAYNPQLQIIISNTTEVGITLVKDDVKAAPPVSFPGKLLAFLLERYHAFNGTAESGMVIVPTELIPGNGSKLKNIVIELAKQNTLDAAFINWVTTANDFCNSLVDRIVPGKLAAPEAMVMENKLGYRDDLMIMSEVYCLWAIETSSKRTADLLSFSKADKGVVIASDIEKFRELKLRLLNGSHTLTCGLAVMSGFTTVKQAMDNEYFSRFITQLMYDEIVPAIACENVPAIEARQFAATVLDRFRNPFIEHHWLSICLQYTSKMKMRNIQVLLQYYEKTGTAPQYVALGFAAWLLFMKSEKNSNGFTGHVGGKEYVIQDDLAAYVHELWRNDNKNIITNILSDIHLWGVDLSALPGFTDAVTTCVHLLEKQGGLMTLKNFMAEKII